MMTDRNDSRLAGRVSLAIVGCAWAAVLLVGWLAPIPMVGDEVTHFHMLTTQSQCLTTPNFLAHIPVAFAESGYETRCYPHVFLWHYIGAVVYRLGGGSPYLLQLVHSLFWLQLLLALRAIARDRRHGDGVADLPALALAASLPMALIFAVVFYQDVPATAQVLTAFLLLRRRRWLLSAVFMALALSIKENMFLFLPAYTVLFVGAGYGRRRWAHIRSMVVAMLVILASCAAMAWSIQTYAGSDYYPVRMLKMCVSRALALLPASGESDGAGAAAVVHSAKAVSLYDDGVIAHHPGDLRNAANWLLYGGALLWPLLGLAGVGAWFTRFGRPPARGAPAPSAGWLWLTGLSYIALAAVLLRTSPDARFFMPGLLFCLIPLSESAARVPYRKVWLSALVMLAVAQTGAVLHKTYRLRHVPTGVGEAIRYLESVPPDPNRVFMYPEGNYRLFPCQHNWYLGYRLREFWKADNDQRLRMLRHANIGAIVIKKYMVGTLDKDMNNLGIYPDQFVRDLARDARFEKTLDNKHVTIYLVPPRSEAPAPRRSDGGARGSLRPTESSPGRPL